MQALPSTSLLSKCAEQTHEQVSFPEPKVRVQLLPEEVRREGNDAEARQGHARGEKPPVPRLREEIQKKI